MTDHAHLSSSFADPASAPANPPAVASGRDIVVNGRRCLVHADHISHGQLVSLAFPNGGDLEANRSSLTVSYRGGPHTAPEGILSPVERTPIADGETFVVTRTDKS